MPVVTTDFLSALMTGYRTIFQQSLDEAFAEPQLKEQIATQFDSNTDKESYSWMGANPTMEEWKDKRQYRDLNLYDYTLTNKHYEGTIAVSRDTYEDDKYGMIAPRVRGLANRAVRHWNQLAVSQLDNGETLLAYDSVEFFSDTRVLGTSGNIDNLLSGSYSGSETEIRAALAAAFVAMQNFKDDKGVPMGLVPDTIVCSPSMLIALRQALLPGVAGTTRPEAGIFSNDRIFSSPWIDNDSLDWYVLCTRQVEVRPIIFQMRKQPEFISIEDPKQDHVFNYNEFLYGVDDRFAVGYGDPRTAIKIVDA